MPIPSFSDFVIKLSGGKPFRRQLYAQLIEQWPVDRPWEEIVLAAKKQAEVAWNGDAYELIENFENEAGSRKMAKAVYYWLHLNYPARARAVDVAAFGASLFGGEAAIVNSGSLLQPPLYFPDEVQVAHEKNARDGATNWLSPWLVDALPFVGRFAELRALTAFARRDERFLVWAISGPSGAGKTRLAIHWMREFAKGDHACPTTGWNIGILTNDAQKLWSDQGGDWKIWQPNRPTFIIIDYVHLFSEHLATIFRRWGGLAEKRAPDYPVRILLIDHVFPERLEDLIKDPRFRGLSTGGADLDRKKTFFAEQYPLPLTADQQSPSELLQIVHEAAKLHGAMPSEATLSDAVGELSKIEGAWCPLFAALRGRALAINSRARFSDRRDLIRNYLETTNRIPWLSNDAELAKIGDWVGCCVAAATVVGGASYRSLISSLPSELERDSHARNQIIFHGSWVVSKRLDNDLHPFEPDILGETFLLLFWQHARHSANLSRAFIQMCAAGETSSEANFRSVKFVEFGRRLGRNLANDSQDDPHIRLYWNLLTDLINPVHFQANTPIRRAASILLVNVSDELVSLFRARRAMEYHATIGMQCIARVDEGDLVEACIGPSSRDAILGFMSYCRHMGTRNWTEPQPLAKLAKIFRVFDAALQTEGQKHLSVLTLAATEGNEDVTSVLVSNPLVDVNGGVEQGGQPLIAASERGHETIIRMLLSRSDILVNAQREDGATALVLASQNGNLGIAKTLIDHKETDINLTATGRGTPLIQACQNGHVEIVQHLLAHSSVQVNARRGDGSTALILASDRDSVRVIELLLGHAGIDVNISSDDGITALMAAANSGNAAALRALVADQRIDVNSTQEIGLTALHFACLDGNADNVAQLLCCSNIDVNAEAADGTTPLMCAALKGTVESIELLTVVKGINLDAFNLMDWTAMDIAKQRGDRNIIAALAAVGARRYRDLGA